MDWANEKYVRLYIRNTADWMAMCWQARALFPLMLRVCDRSGVISMKPGANRIRLLAGLALLPAEVVEPGIADLLADGCVVENEGGFVIRNFLEAQEAESSDAKRAKEYRERRRAVAMAEPAHSVTKRDAASQNVTDRHAESESGCKSSLLPSVPSTPSVPSSQKRSVADATERGVRGDAAGPDASPPPEASNEPPAEAPSPEAERPKLKLKPTPADKPPLGPSKHRERAEWIRETCYRASGETYDDWCMTDRDANVTLKPAVDWVAKQYAVPEPEAWELTQKGCELWSLEPWPGQMTTAPPWGPMVFLKHKHLGHFIGEALKCEWRKNPENDSWEVVRRSA